MLREMRRRSLVLCALVLLVVLAAFVPATATAKPGASGQRDAALEQGILREVNRVRAARGLRALTLSTPLQSAATFQSRDMIERGYFDHDQPGGVSFGERLRRFYPVVGSGHWSVGENLLWSTQGIGAAAALRLWLASPPHRRNIFDPTWRDAGVGAFVSPTASGAFSAAGGPVVVVTMDFGARSAARATQH